MVLTVQCRGENWLDLRRIDKWGSLMLRRIEDAKRAGCQGIEFDNPDISMRPLSYSSVDPLRMTSSPTATPPPVIHIHNLPNGGENTVEQCIAVAKVTSHHHDTMPHAPAHACHD
jgi:hypothetical protein